MRSRRTLTLLFSIYLISTACSSDETSQDHSFQIVEEDGIPVAITSGGPKYEGDLFHYEEVVRLHQDESNENSILYRATQYLMGEDGNYYVCDIGNTRIAVYGPNGNYIRSFGRNGDGPGEFRTLRILWIRDNNLAVFDSRNRRTSLFNLDGTFVQSFSFLKARGISELHPVQNGCMVVIEEDGSPMAWPQGYQPVAQGEYLTRFTRATVISQQGDTLNQVESQPNRVAELIGLDERDRPFFSRPYYSPRSGIQFHPDKGILVYSTAVPEFKWYDLEGNLKSIVSIELKPPPVTSEDRQAIMKMLDGRIQSATNEQTLARAKLRKKHARIPDVKPYWTSITIDDQGYYWLEGNPDYRAEGMAKYHQPMKVLNPDGEYLGDSRLPEMTFNISRGHVLTYHEDEETGESLFIVFQIVPAVEGLEYP